ncbi:hypothetical protein [Desulfosporosinus youngiae]|uniref:Uncharacterized protein n=1 Tax=Desulfosporosinus youngiae DSM 17734 TaxID=768710 RepID=H5Y1S0_9FIRM|nr:hypothetical protein [Desulfosporosinus youngiae]EHQ87823.1 hypothetical protein DesyoDRAFT_0643 [Desulfosporosinus youngiae DSM 17734]
MIALKCYHEPRSLVILAMLDWPSTIKSSKAVQLLDFSQGTPMQCVY